MVLRGSLEEHIAYTFFIYDLNQDGSINKDEMFCILRNALWPPSNNNGLQEEAEEGIRDLIQMTKKKLDLDKDDVISFEDYDITVRKDPLMLLEVFGTCIPSERVSCRPFLRHPHLLRSGSSSVRCSPRRTSRRLRWRPPAAGAPWPSWRPG